jgi:transcriptional regulator with XRE-family HTH domain
MTDVVTQRKSLRDFLRAARARVNPAELGIVAPPGRRGHGLQQADIADELRVSHRWYNGFENGTLTANTDMLDRIAALLRLTPAERANLYLLATGHDPAPASVQPPDGADAVLTRLVHQMGDLAVPALVTDIAWNVIGWNHALTTWFPDPADFSPGTRNLVLWAFTGGLERYVRDVDCFRRTYIGWVHLAHAGRPDDPRLAHLVDRLQAIPAARELLSSHHIADFTNSIIPVQFRLGPGTEPEETDLLNIEFPGGSRLIMISPRNARTARTGSPLRLIPPKINPDGPGSRQGTLTATA